jgi:hypothetical protein
VSNNTEGRLEDIIEPTLWEGYSDLMRSVLLHLVFSTNKDTIQPKLPHEFRGLARGGVMVSALRNVLNHSWTFQNQPFIFEELSRRKHACSL